MYVVIRYTRESPLLMVGRAALYYVGGGWGPGWLAIIPLEHVQRKINLMTKVST